MAKPLWKPKGNVKTYKTYAQVLEERTAAFQRAHEVNGMGLTTRGRGMPEIRKASAQAVKGMRSSVGVRAKRAVSSQPVFGRAMPDAPRLPLRTETGLQIRQAAHPQVRAAQGPLARSYAKLEQGLSVQHARNQAATALRAAPRPIAKAAVAAAREGTSLATPYEYPKNITSAIKRGSTVLQRAQASRVGTAVARGLGIAGKAAAALDKGLGGAAVGLGPVHIAKRHAERFMAPKGARNRYETKA